MSCHCRQTKPPLRCQKGYQNPMISPWCGHDITIWASDASHPDHLTKTAALRAHRSGKAALQQCLQHPKANENGERAADEALLSTRGVSPWCHCSNTLFLEWHQMDYAILVLLQWHHNNMLPQESNNTTRHVMDIQPCNKLPFHVAFDRLLMASVILWWARTEDCIVRWMGGRVFCHFHHITG